MILRKLRIEKADYVNAFRLPPCIVSWAVEARCHHTAVPLIAAFDEGAGRCLNCRLPQRAKDRDMVAAPCPPQTDHLHLSIPSGRSDIDGIQAAIDPDILSWCSAKSPFGRRAGTKHHQEDGNNVDDGGDAAVHADTVPNTG